MKGLSLAKSFIALLVLSSLVCAESSMLAALQNYYKYSKEENSGSYFSTIDLSEFTDHEIQLKKDLVSELWGRFDTLDYALSNVHEYSNGDFGIIEYHLNAIVQGPDGNGGQGQFSYSDDFVATMRQVDGVWKVNNVQQADVFAANMENFFLDSQTNVIDEINTKAIEKIDAQPPGGIENATTKTETTTNQTGQDNQTPSPAKSQLPCIGGFVIAGTGLLAYLSGRKQKR